MTIYSPINGVVMERFLSPGEFVEDQPVLKLAQIHPLYVEVFAPVELLGTIKVGMPADVIVRFKERHLVGFLKLIGGRNPGDPATNHSNL